MADMKLFLELLVKNSGFRSGLDGSGRDVSRFTQGARREMDSLKGTVRSLQGTLAGLGLSFGAIQGLAASARLDRDLTQIGQTAGASAKEVAGLRQELFRMGGETGQDIQSLKSGFDSLVQSGLNMKESSATLDGINIAMAVTGARAESLAAALGVASAAFDFDLAKPGQALELLDKMTVAGRAGNAELTNLPDIFARVGVNAKSAGFSLEQTLGYIETLSKVERNPERLATLADSTLRVFTNQKYMAAATAGTGISFYDKKGSRRDPLAVLGDIKKKYETLKTDLQRDTFVGSAFGQADLDTIKGIRTLLDKGNLQDVAQITGLIKEGGGTLRKDMDAAMANAVAQTGRLKNELAKAGDAFAQPVNEAITKLIKTALDPKAKGGFELSGEQILVGGGAALVTAMLAKRFGPKLLKGLVGGGVNVAEGVAIGKGLEKMAGVTPVYVVNMPGSMNGSSAVSDAVAGTAARGHRLKNAGRVVSLMTGPVGQTVAVMSILSELIGEAQVANGWGSQIFGQGSREYEVMGLGGRKGDFLDEAKRAAFAGANVKNEISIDLRIDRDGRLVVVSNDTNTNVSTNVRRGSFDDAILRPNL